MRFQITHWDMSTPHDQTVVEVEAADFDAASEQTMNLVGFGRTYAIAVLPEPEPEPEPEPVVAEEQDDKPELPARPKRHRRLKDDRASRSQREDA